MSKRMMIVGFALLSQNSFAGALPYEWWTCKAEGKNANGEIVAIYGAGINDVEASDNAIYFCRDKGNLKGCEVTSCKYEVVRPR